MSKLAANLLPFCLFLLSFIDVTAQDKLPIKFGKVAVKDFDVQSPLIDSGTAAVVVADVGNSSFIANSSESTFSLLFKQKKRIKILNKNGFDAATIVIPLYVSDDGRAEKFEDLDAYTYNLEDGKVVQTKVDKASVFTEKASKNWIHRKFTFPAVKEGSIIEYSMEIKSDFFFNLQPWTFQGEYPVLWSEYEAGIPEFYKFVILSQGYQPFAVNKTEESRASFSFTEHVDRTGGTGFGSTGVGSGLHTFKIDGQMDYHTWIMKNVPPLKEEAFTTTLKNSIARIEFQLKAVAYPNQAPRPYMNTWQKVSEELMANDRFGLPIKRANNWLDDEVQPLVNGAANDKEKARRIFEYVRDHFACTNRNTYYISTSLKDVVKAKSGSVADINMLLIAMLRNQNISADPVLLSTRSHGYTHQMYPLMDRFNYVIAKVSLEDGAYYLDAATPRLGFNRLSAQALNGHARVINQDAEPVYFVADSVLEATNTMVFIEPSEKGVVEGGVTKQLGYYHSLGLRNKLANTTLENIKKEFQDEVSEEVAINNLSIDSLKRLDDEVKIQYDIKLNAFGESEVVYFSPMLGEAIRKNPFAAAERLYPVEMPYAIDDTYILNMKVPRNYVVDELPKSVRLMFNEDEGMFEYLISAADGIVQMRCRLQLKRATYTNEDYQSLRDFYAYIVKKEAEQIVFKKVK